MNKCPDDCPIPGARSFSQPEGTGSLRVLILGEALGEAEAADGLPFRPYAPAGSLLERAIRRSSFTRDQFVLWNVVPVQPPKNWLEGAPWEAAAVAWGLPMLRKVIDAYKPACILALGNVAFRAASGLAGISINRGFPLGGCLGIPVVGSFHPSFIRRGAMPLQSVLMHDLKLAVAVAHAQRTGQSVRFFSPVLSRDVMLPQQLALGIFPDPYNPVVPSGYLTHPSEQQAFDFLRDVEAHPSWLVAYDIETPRSREVDENESDELNETQILSCQLSYEAGSGIYLPWRDPFIEVARRVLALPNAKAGANTWRFDDPLLEAHGCPLGGTRHDVRWAWHALQPDMKGALQFIASFYAPEFGPWKHLHESHVGYYGIADVDVIQRIM